MFLNYLFKHGVINVSYNVAMYCHCHSLALPDQCTSNRGDDLGLCFGSFWVIFLISLNLTSCYVVFVVICVSEVSELRELNAANILADHCEIELVYENKHVKLK